MSRLSFFFNNPIAATAIVGCSSMFILLFPTSIILGQLGDNQRNSGGRRDKAKADSDQAENDLRQKQNALQKALQHITDIDCAMAGDEAFNLNVFATLSQFRNSTKSGLDRLNSDWLMTFIADKTTMSTNSVQKSFSRREWVYGPYRTCNPYPYVCPSQQSCCTIIDWHYEDIWYKYTEITQVTTAQVNILQGSGFRITPLLCGDYSREFTVSSPQVYNTYVSPPSTHGSRDTGTVFITSTIEQGSKVTARYTLDSSSPSTDIIVPRSTSQATAADNVAAALLQYLAAAFAVFNVTGMKYAALQDSIRNSLPGLENAVAASNAAFMDKSGLLADAQANFDGADGMYQTGLKIWLPLFFIIPPVLALITCLIACKGRDCTNDESEGHNMSAFSV